MISIPLFCTFIAIIICFYASYTDLKSGIIPNKLTFPLIGLGIILNAIYAFMVNDILLIAYTLIFTVGIFIFGYIFWKLGAWAGGDVKLFTALAALLPFYDLLPFYPAIFNYNLFTWEFPIISMYPFPLTLIINSVLSTFPFLLIYVLFIAIRRKPYLLDEILSPIKNDYKKNIVLALVITSAINLAIIISPYLRYQMIIIILILIYLLTLIISRLPNRIKAVVVSVLTVFALYTKMELTIISMITIFMFIIIIDIIKKLLTSVSKKALQDDYEIGNLKEGMIPAYKMYEQDNKIYVDDKGFFEKIKESFRKGNTTSLTAHKGKLLIGSMAAGLTNDDITLLKKLSEENKIPNKFKIKRGVPFAPSILIGLIISLVIGDMALILQKILYMFL